MPKILVTAFDPFGGERINPAQECVRRLPATISGADVMRLEVPTSFSRSAAVLERAMSHERADYVLCVGQAGGRAAISVERVAINLVDARIPDNDGAQPHDEAIREDGAPAYFATLPTKAMIRAMRERGIPATLSYTAGTFVCNWLMYQALYLAERLGQGTRAGFVHVPYAPEQGVGKAEGTATMAVSDMTRALELGIGAIVEAGSYCSNWLRYRLA